MFLCKFVLGKSSKLIDAKKAKKDKQVNFDEKNDYALGENDRTHTNTLMLFLAHPCFDFQELEKESNISRTTVLLRARLYSSQNTPGWLFSRFHKKTLSITIF